MLSDMLLNEVSPSEPSGCPQNHWLSILIWCPLDFVHEIAAEGQVQGEIHPWFTLVLLFSKSKEALTSLC